MARDIPKNLEYFLKNALTDSDDGYEYASELNRILNSDTCQLQLTDVEVNKLRDYADKVKKFGEINYPVEHKIRELEAEMFGTGGIYGYLKIKEGNKSKVLDDLFNF